MIAQLLLVLIDSNSDVNVSGVELFMTHVLFVSNLQNSEFGSARILSTCLKVKWPWVLFYFSVKQNWCLENWRKHIFFDLLVWLLVLLPPFWYIMHEWWLHCAVWMMINVVATGLGMEVNSTSMVWVSSENKKKKEHATLLKNLTQNC